MYLPVKGANLNLYLFYDGWNKWRKLVNFDSLIHRTHSNNNESQH